MRKIFIVILSCLWPALSLAAQNPPVVSDQEIIGCWERINFSEKAQKTLNEIEPWPLPYQWFCFEQDGTLYSLNTSSYSKQTSASLRDAFKVIPKDVKYTILQKGIIKTEQKSIQQTLVWGANFTGNKSLFDGKDIDKGTLFMSLYNQKKGKNVYYRYLKKVE